MLPTLEELLSRIAGLPGPPVAIEALWDGDSYGWFINLAAVVQDAGGYRSHHLASLQDGGDIRLFNRQVPPWPEAQLAREVGEELSRRLEIPFYFPSPEHPEDDCPGWAERARGSPCRRCGIPLLQGGGYARPGLCYYCFLEVEGESRTEGGQDA
jgi:hypothetical protein